MVFDGCRACIPLERVAAWLQPLNYEDVLFFIEFGGRPLMHVDMCSSGESGTGTRGSSKLSGGAPGPREKPPAHVHQSLRKCV